ncbi:unnamed protein product [Dovyalis caffra]|uniref:60S ribosomal protein L35 n=1 Tax=Dovyalis caffra TaxID=77055 RepID=A0AAV1SNJ3_9ROSI|nr:unnamed protein product [Dovyalis caffra]
MIGPCLMESSNQPRDESMEKGLKRDKNEAIARIKVLELREKSKVDLLARLKDLKAELALLHATKVTDDAPNKLSKIKVVRFSIARVLTMIS